MALDRYDYIIIGAGSAGCVLAARLSEDPGVKVLVLEAGGRNTSMLVRMPAGAGVLFRNKNAQNWGFWTEPEPNLGGRRIFWPRGRGWGGSSAINGMVYIRGHARDYDQWRQMGLRGWSYADVLPYFMRSETREGGGDDWHGAGGPLHVSTGTTPHPIFNAFVEAGAQAGHKLTPDFNGAQQEGFGRFQLTIKDGKRWSTSTAFLRPALARPNLTAVTGARTTRILIEKGRAVGVEFQQDGQTRRVHADREVLLSAGAVQSPQILQLSGVGDPESLRAAGVDTVHALPGVGANLQDHLDVTLAWEAPTQRTAHSVGKGLSQITTGLSYALFGQGPGRQNYLEAGAFLKSRPDLDRPDLQLHCVLAIIKFQGMDPVAKDGFSVHVCQLRPESRGRVALRSADPFDDPAIFANYLSAPEDLRTLRRGVDIVRDLARQKALTAISAGEFSPGAAVSTDEEIEAWIRGASETIYHPVGTCRMGAPGDAQAVVDDTLKVFGLDGLRVVDASVMPTLVGGNTNAPTIMIAEKAADMILGRTPPSPSEARVFGDREAALAP